MKRTIVAIITDVLGDRVIIGDNELSHAIEGHFEFFPKDMLLELLERILKDPTIVYEEKTKNLYHLFYRLENKKFIVVVVKRSESGSFLSTIYPTGKDIRNKHKKFKKVKL